MSHWSTSRNIPHMNTALSKDLFRYSQSVWQAPDPSLGQNRVSAFFLPSCSCCGSGSRARQVYLNLCSCRDPFWLTFTGIQGVQGVLRRTSGQASRLQTLNSWSGWSRHCWDIAEPQAVAYVLFTLSADTIRPNVCYNSLWTACRNSAALIHPA